MTGVLCENHVLSFGRAAMQKRGRCPLRNLREAALGQALDAVRAGGGVVGGPVTLPTGERVASCDDPRALLDRRLHRRRLGGQERQPHVRRGNPPSEEDSAHHRRHPGAPPGHSSRAWRVNLLAPAEGPLRSRLTSLRALGTRNVLSARVDLRALSPLGSPGHLRAHRPTRAGLLPVIDPVLGTRSLAREWPET